MKIRANFRGAAPAPLMGKFHLVRFLKKDHELIYVFKILCENSHLDEHNKRQKNGSQVDVFQNEAISCVGLMAKKA